MISPFLLVFGAFVLVDLALGEDFAIVVWFVCLYHSLRN